MLGKISVLHRDLQEISDNFLNHEKRNDMLPIQKSLMQMQEFTIWFLGGNRLELDDQEYEELKQELLLILADILDAIESKDCVLLHDAVTFGFMKFLEPFMEGQSGEKTDDNL